MPENMYFLPVSKTTWIRSVKNPSSARGRIDSQINVLIQSSSIFQEDLHWAVRFMGHINGEGKKL